MICTMNKLLSWRLNIVTKELDIKMYLNNFIHKYIKLTMKKEEITVIRAKHI